MDRYTTGGGSTTPPTPDSGASSSLFWAKGAKVTAYFLHMVTESLRNLITSAGLTPDKGNLNLLRDAVIRLGNGYDPYFIGGPPPERPTASTLIIRQGTIAVDVSSGEVMKVTGADLTVDITNTGINGLDAGTEANNTWYYLWLIKHPANGNVRGLLSANPTSPTLPDGYTRKRRLPIAVRNDASGNFIQQRLSGGYPNAAEWKYDTGHSNAIDTTARTRVIPGALSETGWTSYDLSAYVPAISTVADLQVRVNQTGTVAFRRPGATHQGDGNYFSDANALGIYDNQILSPAQAIEIRTAVGSGGSVDAEVVQWTAGFPTV